MVSGQSIIRSVLQTEWKFDEISLRIFVKALANFRWVKRNFAVISHLQKRNFVHPRNFARAKIRATGAPWVKKCGKPPIRENLVITWPRTRTASQANQCKIIQSTWWQTKCNSRFYLERNRMAARNFSKKKQQIRVFFDVIFYVYTRVDNWERARARDWKQKRRILCEEKHAAAVRQWELLTVSRWKWRAVKNKSEHDCRRQNIG